LKEVIKPLLEKRGLKLEIKRVIPFSENIRKSWVIMIRITQGEEENFHFSFRKYKYIFKILTEGNFS